MQPSSNISRLLEIMAALRDPQQGCPWDLEQTFQTIVPYTIEEAHEVADAIERNDMPDLCEELGDLLLQVVFHARMAEELRHFDFGDVVMAITEKMIRRHPHVFGDDEARSVGHAKGMWNKIKAEEKMLKAKRRTAAGLPAPVAQIAYLDAIPASLPAVPQSIKLQEHAAKVGFDWSEPQPILDKIEEEIGELRDVMGNGDTVQIAEEYGDILFAMMNLGRRLGVDPESALRRTNMKFRRRFSYIETSLGNQGVALENAGLQRMEELWQEAKTYPR